MKKNLLFVWMAAALSILCLSGCVVTPPASEGRYEQDRPVYRDDRPVYPSVDIGDLQQRIGMLDQRIDLGMRNGLLTRDEGRMLRLELQQVKEDASRMLRDGRMTQREKDRINADLDRLEKRIVREVRDDDRQRPRQEDIRDLEQRIAALQQKIDFGIRKGALTRDEGRALDVELQQVKQDASRMLRDGRMTQREKDRINADLDRLEKRIVREVRDDDRQRPRQEDIGDIEKRIAQLNQRIDAGLRDRSLGPVRARSLRADVKKIEDQAARLKKDGRISRQEKDRLNEALDRLWQDLEKEKSAGRKRWK